VRHSYTAAPPSMSEERSCRWSRAVCVARCGPTVPLSLLSLRLVCSFNPHNRLWIGATGLRVCARVPWLLRKREHTHSLARSLWRWSRRLSSSRSALKNCTRMCI